MDEKLDLERPGPERDPEIPAARTVVPTPKMTAPEALRRYSGRTQILLGAAWYFARDGWFNRSEKMQEHLGFNRVGTFILVPFLVYSFIMLLSSYRTVRREKLPPAPAAVDFKRYRLQSILWIGVVIWFYTNSWRVADINPILNQCSAPVLVAFIGFSLWKWRAANERLAQEPPPASPPATPAS